jgi:hypothetical protein
MMEFPQARLLIFAKAPLAGRVKTRLARCYGPRGAAALYRAMLARTLRMATEADLCPIQMWCAPDFQHGFFASCRRDYGVALRVQSGQDLGARMNRALREALKTATFALIIGGDCVSLDADDLRFALAALAAGKDAVLGPAEDGGYVLIGLRRPRSGLFGNIHWGGPRVLAATRRRLAREGLSWVELPARWDVDRPADVRRLKRELDF